MDFSETIEVKVIDAEDRILSDAYYSYFFAYFHNMTGSLEQIRDAVRTYKPQAVPGLSDAVRDTTGVKISSSASTNASPLMHTMSLPAEPQVPKTGYSLKLPIPSIPFLRPFQSDSGAHTPTQHNQTKTGKQFETITPSTSASSTKTVTKATAESGMGQRALSDTVASPSNRLLDYSHTYPPPPSPESEIYIPTSSSTGSTSSWTGWLKSSKWVFNSPSALSSGATIGRKGVSEVISNSMIRHVDDSVSSDFGFSVLETRDHPAEPEIAEKFRSTFAFDEKEQLLGCECYL